MPRRRFVVLSEPDTDQRHTLGRAYALNPPFFHRAVEGSARPAFLVGQVFRLAPFQVRSEGSRPVKALTFVRHDDAREEPSEHIGRSPVCLRSVRNAGRLSEAIVKPGRGAPYRP